VKPKQFYGYYLEGCYFLDYRRFTLQKELLVIARIND
jgi:hypothetical protein